jgi:hypothetical protein
MWGAYGVENQSVSHVSELNYHRAHRGYREGFVIFNSTNVTSTNRFMSSRGSRIGIHYQIIHGALSVFSVGSVVVYSFLQAKMKTLPKVSTH